MNKDVIYLDVDDDITTIVGKIKASKEKIVALVPPKRVGVLQSAVNMRLLTRTAEQAGKRVVLISNDHALAMLAAAAKIPVAKNLQSKPEIAEIPALKIDDNDVIDGSELPVGELVDSATPTVDAEGAAVASVIAAEAVKKAPGGTKNAAKTSKKVPDFTTFRKKLVLIGGGVALLIGFLIWAIWFAPRATVIITAKTNTVTIDGPVSLSADGPTDSTKKVIKTLKQEQKVELTTQFSATGKKNIGDKATGTVTMSISQISLLGKTVPAGTVLTASGGSQYVTDSAVTFGMSNYGGAKVGITAADRGSSYNGASGSVSGAPSGVAASITQTTSGGTDKTATVVSEDDLAKAVDALASQKPTDIKAKVQAGFASSAVVIEESYREQRSDPQPSVLVGQEATSPVNVSATVTGSMLAIDQKDLAQYLEAAVKKEIEGKKSQKIYDGGEKKVKFAQFTDQGGAMTVRLTTNATVGPTIDEAQVKQQAQGRNYGDIQSSLESIPGVDDVDTKFWPFWVRTVPNDEKRITVEFKLHNAS